MKDNFIWFFLVFLIIIGLVGWFGMGFRIESFELAAKDNFKAAFEKEV